MNIQNSWHTDSFMWKDEKLGKGATGDVMKCYNKKTGEAFAAKIFPYCDNRSTEVKNREVDILKKLDHPNIVKFYTLEYMRRGHELLEAVIIMELCSNSMYDIIEQAENSFGLEESTFIDVIKQVSLGLEYLYHQTPPIVHRDVKPGNILRSKKSKGRYVYKICDFGAAREVPDSGQFCSIYGTPEYLFPDMYEKALMKKSSPHEKKNFDSQVDLWSFGGTIYHLASGTTPFKPLKGAREDKDTMFEMIDKKPSGAISCSQDINGKLIFSTQLPPDCRLSKSFKLLVTPILKGLLEVKHPGKISHDECFQKIKQVTSMMALHIFVAKQCLHTKIYMNKIKSPPSLDIVIKTHLGIQLSPDDIYFFNNKLIKDHATVYDLNTTADNPIIIVSSDVENSECLEVFVNNEKSKKFMQSKNYQYDSSLAKDFVRLAHQFQRSAKKCNELVKAIKLTHTAIENEIMTKIESYQTSCRDILKECQKTISFSKSNEDIVVKVNKRIGDIAEVKEEKEPETAKLSEVIDQLQVINDNTEEMLPKNHLSKLWDEMTEQFDQSNTTLWLDCIREEVDQMYSTYQYFIRTAKYQPSSFEDIVRKAKKNGLQQSYSDISHYHDQIVMYKNHLHDTFGKWLMEGNNLKKKIENLHKELSTCQINMTSAFNNEIQNFEQQLLKGVDKIKAEFISLSKIYPDLLQMVNMQKTMIENLNTKIYGNES